ncbi:MAG: 5-dehydro-4-deoxy-D-glucuronate isomerase [Alphaproteobacteria bacterium]|jgi:4-deoxy-L-threo-5-hexosulose-uronate ketol-isomerase|nr:5-dehydro-4-deoxy-D-glucuronate isomerase [Alphaproteobacteria bacterium]
MKERFEVSRQEVKRMTTAELRENFLIEVIFKEDTFIWEYSYYDRMIIGGIMPITKELSLPLGEEISCEYFLQRREIGVINIGGDGEIIVDGVNYNIANKDGIYIGCGVKEVIFKSLNKDNPSKFYFNSSPAHAKHETCKISLKDANKQHLGDIKNSNQRTIYQYIHPKVCKSSQLVMGLTILEEGNMWNTMPCHTHSRRMETYFYFNFQENSRVFHFMGEPTETKHLLIANEQAVISPSWSIHSGCGTSAYAFIWAMAGENQDFTDMDFIPMDVLK